jgi:MbtH protein
LNVRIIRERLNAISSNAVRGDTLVSDQKGWPVNPFEDPDARYLVLINDEGQHSLWPVFADVPKGWEVIFGEEGRQECLDFIEKNWTDMRPNSLIRQMEAEAAAQQNGASRREEVAPG